MSQVEVLSDSGAGSELNANVAAVALMLLVESTPLILMAKRRVLKDKKFLFTMPGGSLETGESVKQGGKRELLEETGLNVRAQDLKLVGSPYVINPSIVIQYLFCHLDTSAPWQYVVHAEPNKMGPWHWMNMEEFGKLEQLGVYPDIDITGHVETIVRMTEARISLIDNFARDDTWLAWIHERDLRRMYGLR